MFVDSIIILFIAYCLIRGIWQGTVNEAFSIAGLFIGLIAASAYYLQTARLIFHWIDNLQTFQLAGFFVTFGAAYLTVKFLGIIMAYLCHIVVSGWGSRITGGVMGSLKGLLFVAVLFIPLAVFSPTYLNHVRNSRLLSVEAIISAQLIHVISKEMQCKFYRNIDDAKKASTLEHKSST
jgi:uncharacterized membrane protein required for colicin V production